MNTINQNLFTLCYKQSCKNTQGESNLETVMTRKHMTERGKGRKLLKAAKLKAGCRRIK